LLKLLFHPVSRRLLGVHTFGTGATELVHIGQTVMAAGMPIDYFVDSVFNYPTLAECYKVAALDGINRIRVTSDADIAPVAPCSTPSIPLAA
jgi:NAD(P) transhydrogenase